MNKSKILLKLDESDGGPQQAPGAGDGRNQGRQEAVRGDAEQGSGGGGCEDAAAAIWKY